jgi:hypothetical protein
LDAWIQTGGQLILTGGGWGVRAKSPRSTPRPPTEKDDKERAEGRAPNAAPTPTTEYLARHGLARKAGTHAVGRGRIVVVSDKFAFSNDALRKDADAAVRLTGLCAAWGQGGAAFDEYHQGFGEKRGIASVLGSFLATPWGFATLQAAAAGVLFMFGTKRRFGRPIEAVAQERSSPVDVIDARGELFRAAQARMLSLQLIHWNLSQNLGGPFSGSIGVPDDPLDEAARERLAGNDAELAADLGLYAKLVAAANARGDVSATDLLRVAALAGTIQRRWNDAAGSAGTRQIAG